MSPSKVHRKAWKALEDPHQQVLAPKSKSGTRFRSKEAEEMAVPWDERVMCPFCLHIGKVKDFRVPKKKGYSTRKAECPECGVGMLMKTLLADMTPEEFAEWVYGYRLSGFWQKCSFKKFTKRMYDMGWSYRFWARYKELRGVVEEEYYRSIARSIKGEQKHYIGRKPPKQKEEVRDRNE